MAACPTLATGDAFLSSLLLHIECRAQTMGATGYQVLSEPGSPFALALTGLLTIFVALLGMRMALGERPSLREGVMAVVKIGVVLTLATSWPAYRTVVYDVIIHGPAQISGAVAQSAGLPGADADLIQRLQGADSAITRLINLGSGRPDVPAAPATPGEPPQRTPIADDPAWGTARVVFLSSTVAAVALVRLTAGILLALGPLFAGLLLFDSTRGVVVGWARALVFAMLASSAVTLLLGVELALLEPWLANVISLRQDKVATVTAPVELLVLCLAFTLALFGALAVILRLSFTVTLPRSWRPSAIAERFSSTEPSAEPARPPASERSSSRAHAVAEALFASQRRERGRAHSTASGNAQKGAGAVAIVEDFTIPAPGHAPRRTKPRKSLGSALRDRRT